MTASAAIPPAAVAEPQAEADFIAGVRERLKQGDAALAARFDAGEDVDRLTRARSAMMDSAVRDI